MISSSPSLPSMSSWLLAIILLLIIPLNDVSALSDIVSKTESLDLCGGNGHIDSHALNIGSVPWNIAKRFKTSDNVDTQHYIDISPCQTFKSSHYNGYFIPKECQDSQICHNITTTGSPTKSIGYNLKYINLEFDTVKATYTGPVCDMETNMNYTIDIRFICGNHLGHPSFPLFTINNSCRTILNWETSAACKVQRKTSTFGLNEMKCYVVDSQNRLRDLTPLIHSNGSYQVLADDEEFYLNVCSDITDKCSKDSSACIRNEHGELEAVGSYKWADIKYVPASEQTKHEFVELTYRSSSAKCKPNNAVTKIRFICPNSFPSFVSVSKTPKLISNMDCEYVIEWVTDYACPLEEITTSARKCQFKNVNLNHLHQTEFFVNSTINGKDSRFVLNLCGGVSKNCPSTTSVCLTQGTDSKPIGSRLESKFVKADNRLNMMFQSKNATCSTGSGNLKYEKTIIELECDSTALIPQPTFVGFDQESCIYKFQLRTPIVCPLFDESPVCSFNGRNKHNQLIQIDLSPLRLESQYYSAERNPDEPSMKYALPLSHEIEFNVCGFIPSTTKLPEECHYSAACLYDTSRNDTAFSIGVQANPLVYNEELNSYELVYTGGFNPILKRAVSTKIMFFCQQYNKQIFLVGFNEEESQYVVEFHTIDACPKNHAIGNNCIVKDTLTNTIFDLNPLASSSYYIIRNNKEYDFELNVCNPIIGGSCTPGSAICQKELHGDYRNFSLGFSTKTLVYWNSMLNLTFTNGDPYNDAARTPRKSQISFICDPNAEKGHPEFIGEFNRSYSFVWYTSYACPGPVPKKSHCTFENATHFIDFSPLSLERGNHFVLDDNNSIIFINFCRSLNKIRDNQLQNCRASSAACLVNNYGSKSTSLNLGEPSERPLMGYDGTVYIMYNNGDPCEHDKSINWTTNIHLQCDKDLGQDSNIMLVEPDNRHLCTYEFIVQSPIACPQKLTDVTLENCIFQDKRTNLSADLSRLSVFHDYEIPANKKSSNFYLNICKSVKAHDECANSAVCLQRPDQTWVSYGKVNKLKVHLDENLHLRYTDGERCDKSFIDRKRSADIELICDPNARNTEPVLYFYDECLAKFQWRTPVVCSLKVPSCSLFDEEGNYYSLRQLSSLSHEWKVDSTTDSGHYLINVCKPLQSDECGRLSAVCKIDHNGRKISLGQVSDHEISLDPVTKHLLLTYEEDEANCNGKPFRTQIQFQCSKDSRNGPVFVSENDCTHHFIWNTSFACPHNFAHKTNEIRLDNDFQLHDDEGYLKWDLSKLLSKKLKVDEIRKNFEHYEYVFRFNEEKSSPYEPCAKASVCQMNGKGLYRDIGSIYNWKFMLDDTALHMVITSNNSRCGRNPSKHATTKIFFECVANVNSKLNFLYESEDCEYYFLWQTSQVCGLIEEGTNMNINGNSSSQQKQQKHSTSFISAFILFVLLICVALFVHNYYNGTNFRAMICRISNRFRSSTPTANDVNFRYQQMTL